MTGKPVNREIAQRGFSSPWRLFLVSLVALAFFGGVAFGVHGTLRQSPLVGLGLRAWFTVDGLIKTGTIAPPLLLAPTPDDAPAARVTVPNARAAAPGWRVITAYDRDAGRYLVRLFDRNGAVVHVWKIADPALSKDGFSNELVTPHGLAVLSDGTIVVNSDRMKFLAGYDRCSREIWRRDEAFHHQISTDDEGYVWSWRGAGSAYSQDQSIDRIDPSTGGTVESISLIDDVILPHRGARALFGLAESFAGLSSLSSSTADLFHPNDVQPLPAALAEKFPLFKAGDLLVSFRNINLVAVIDRSTSEIKWSLRGPWTHQHDPEFMETGEISVFDNNHDGTHANTGNEKRSSIVIVNPNNGNLRSFLKDSAVRIFSAEMGAHAWLPGGALQITSSHEGRVLEVDVNTGRVLFDFNNRVLKGYSGNVATADWLPEDYFDEDPHAYSCNP